MSRGKVDIYTIPPNFAEEGTILSGRVRTRNAVETVLLVLFLFQGLMMLPAGNRTKIYVGVIVLLPAAIFSLLGVQGESLSSFIFHFFCYLKKKRLLSEPTGRDRLERNRRLRKREKKLRKQKTRKGGAGHGKRGKGTGKTASRGKKERKGSAQTGEEGTERGET
ncbi:MAG: hypothetical protein U0N90_01315 [Blautia sp.]